VIRCSSCQVECDDNSENCIGCGKGLYALTRGAVLSGRYEVLDAIGKGGMGVVYKARDRELDETVALKVLRGDPAGASEASRRFRSEIKLARKVTHHNVCRIHDYGRENNLTYIVMEYIAGTDLKAELRRRGWFEPREALELVLQVASGLEAVHRQGVVHRDLKTPNVMRMGDGTAKLMDFGIAKGVGGGATAVDTATGLIVGTPEYMSPEQARAEAVDARSDIYALGIVLFELLTGDVPFRGETPLATLLKQIQDPPPLDGPRAARIPPAVLPVLHTALAKNAADRYAAVQEMAADLEQARALLEPPDARPGWPPPSRSQSWGAQGPPPVQGALAYQPDAPVPITTPLATPSTIVPSQRHRLPATVAWAGVVGLGLAVVVGGWLSLGGGQPSPVVSGLGAPPSPARATPPPPVVPSPTAPSPTVPSPTAPSPTRASTPRHEPSPAVDTVPSASSVTKPAVEETGILRIGVKPYAEVFVDGRPAGTTPLGALTLPAGTHTIRLVHPSFQPFQRKVTVRPGESARLVVDLALDGVPR
jgi:serine/threonine protein kinase